MQNGIIPIDKPKGLTSSKAVNIFKKISGIKKVGHGGTLDPIATGMLIIMYGNYTKLSNKIMDLKKTYLTQIQLGIETDTLDITGNTIIKSNCDHVQRKDIENILVNFKGSIEQTPPNYSAIKIKGVRAYDLARKGHEFNIKSRIVVVDSINIIDFNNHIITLSIVCSKGTYIRSIARDIGYSLKTHGSMYSLRRLSYNNKSIMFPLDDQYCSALGLSKYALSSKEQIIEFLCEKNE